MWMRFNEAKRNTKQQKTDGRDNTRLSCPCPNCVKSEWELSLSVLLSDANLENRHCTPSCRDCRIESERNRGVCSVESTREDNSRLISRLDEGIHYYDYY